MLHKSRFSDAIDYIFIADNNYNNADANNEAADNDADDDYIQQQQKQQLTEPASYYLHNKLEHVSRLVTRNYDTISYDDVTDLASTNATTPDSVYGVYGAYGGAAAAAAYGADAYDDASAADNLLMTTDAIDNFASDNLYNGVAVGLGTMLLNETVFKDLDSYSNNDTDYFNSNNNIYGNGTSMIATTNGTASDIIADDDMTELLRIVVTSVILGIMIISTIIGNVFVIAAIILEKNLQNVANYLVASLAVADLFVACLVMPLGAVYEISHGWILGPELCDIWTSCDVLCCTASILHLVAIAVDRYWAVTDIDYIHQRTSGRVYTMIFLVWTVAGMVSLAPQFGWKDPDYLDRIEQQKCMVSQNVGYQVFATCCTFYVPLMIILVLYWKIYQTARKRIHRRRPRPFNGNTTTTNNNQLRPSHKKRRLLRLRFRKLAHTDAATSTTTTTLHLVEGNSNNTATTQEEPEYSSSNVDSKSRAGVELNTTKFTNVDEVKELPVATTKSHEISTVSHLVAIAHQHHTTKTKSTTDTQQTADEANNATGIAAATAATTNGTGVATNNGSAAVSPDSITSATQPTVKAATATATATTEVIKDPQLQQQIEQAHTPSPPPTTAAVHTTTSQANSKTMAAARTPHPPVVGIATIITTATTTTGVVSTTSNATTVTSISALSPQTPTPAHLQQIINSSANTSTQVTPVPRTRNPHKSQQHQQPQLQYSSLTSNPMQKINKRKETLEAKRERKAAKTLAIITGAFVICWLPFFLVALWMPLCPDCEINDSIFSLFLWLGYFNSTLNPVIYTIFSPEFRQAFKRILCGAHRPARYRTGKL